MNIEKFRDFCLSLKGVEESLPFDETTLVFKVMGKIFTICSIDNFTGFAAKCDPERAIELRENYPHGILPGYHLNKKHWNTIKIDENVSDALMEELILHSYDLVAASLTKKLKQELQDLP
jgi:predicted DNA-binding protein (MmcQ/YjbR family)